MTHVLYGASRDQLVRSLQQHGLHIACEDWGEIWVQDGKVWRVDADSATFLGDYFEWQARKAQECTRRAQRWSSRFPHV